MKDTRTATFAAESKSKAMTTKLGTTRLLTADDLEPTSGLITHFNAIVQRPVAQWPVAYELTARLGAGSQGVVFLADRRGAHGFRTQVALKFYSPRSYTDDVYQELMLELTQVATRLAEVQQDHLLDLHNVIEIDGITGLAMEWVDGFDLSELLDRRTLRGLRRRVDSDRWNYVNDVIITDGPEKSRMKPGVAIAIVRECLAGLAALHREGIVHGDIKPGNIMLKRTGNTKLVDFGSAFFLERPPSIRTWTPLYAPPEMVADGKYTRFSDLASLGYVLLEMLSGTTLFRESADESLLDQKRNLSDRLESLLPSDIGGNEFLVNLIRGMIHPDPSKRFPGAEAADLAEEGAAEFQKQLVKGNLSSEYENELRLWLDEVA